MLVTTKKTRPLKTACQRGHDLTVEANIYYDSHKGRHCGICRADWYARNAQAKKEARAAK